MDFTKRIEQGRAYAYGINTSIDLEAAYEAWQGYEALLTREDLETLGFIKESLGVETASPIMNAADIFSLGGVYPTYTQTVSTAEGAAKASYSAAQAKALFAELLADAQKNGTVSSLYLALERYQRSKEKAKAHKKDPKNICFGNNLGYLIHHFWTAIQYFHKTMNKYLVAKGFPEKKSLQGIYQVIGGVHGMQESSKLIVVEMVNDQNRKKAALTRPLESRDLDLPFSEFIALFIEPRFDEKTKRLLNMK